MSSRQLDDILFFYFKQIISEKLHAQILAREILALYRRQLAARVYIMTIAKVITYTLVAIECTAGL